MANRTPLPYLERAEARLNFRIQAENSARNLEEVVQWDRAETRAYLRELHSVCNNAVNHLKGIATVTFVAEAYLALREEATERARRQAAQELAQPLGNNRRSRPY